MGMKSLIASACLVLGLLPMVRAQEPPASIKKVPVHTTQAMAGKDLFHEYCAVCHGNSGKGDGPAAIALKAVPADLTRIAKKNGGKYPDVRVQHIINGEGDEPPAHGSKEMPVWGNIFRHMGANPDLGAVRVYNLVKFIEGMQEK